MAIHGLVHAPRAGFVLDTVTNDGNAQVMGGLVVSSLNLQGSASATNFYIGVDTQPAVVATEISATATSMSASDPGSVTVQAVVEVRVQPHSGRRHDNSCGQHHHV